MNWQRYLNYFGAELLRQLGVDPYGLPGDYNPITSSLKSDPENFLRIAQNIEDYSKINLSRVATVCQMVVFDAQGGPEGDDKPKALRRHWYSWYKIDFAQPFAMASGDFTYNEQGVPEMKDLTWSQRLSGTYAEFVDSGEITYRDLWVEDASRMMTSNCDTLFRDCNIVVAVEKDSLFGDFTNAAQALGAKTVYSGKGKSSKAAIEKVLREHFNWSNAYSDDSDPFDVDKPLIILHISDYDYDGEEVIGPTFAEQASRYTPYILEARVGIEPDHVASEVWSDKWYQVKVNNRARVAWATSKAVFEYRCDQCDAITLSVGRKVTCQNCGWELDLGAVPHGFEVEAIRTREYYRLLVDALLQVLDFGYIINRLRDECTANSYDAARSVAEGIFEENKSYQKLLVEFERLEAVKSEFENRVREELEQLGDPQIHNWRNEQDDPVPEDFRRHVEHGGSNSYANVWRPFSTRIRTNLLVGWLQENESQQIDSFTAEEIG